MAITDKDVDKLKKTFITKEDLRNELNKFATKDDLQDLKNEVISKIDQSMGKFESSIQESRILKVLETSH